MNRSWKEVLFSFANEFRALSKENGAACSLAECDALSGMRCESCSRKICISHTYWRFESVKKVKLLCPLCVVQENRELFSDEDE